MKRILAVLLAMLSIFSISGCRKLSEADLSFFSNTLPKNTTSALKNKFNNKSKKENSEDTSSNASSGASETSSQGTTTSTVAGSSTITSSKAASSKKAPTVNSSSNSTPSNKVTVTEADVDRVVKDFNDREGMQFNTLSNAKYTDTVSMVNLYKATFTDEFAEIDAKLMNALNNNIKTELDTGIPMSNMDFINRYINKLYFYKGIKVKQYYSNGGNALIDTAPLVDEKLALESKAYYKNIQNVISSLGIYKGMPQKTAIEKFNSYICNKAVYDDVSFDASLDGFFKGRATCNSYAQVFEILCRTVGINCEFMGGTALAPQGTYESHAWNKITFSDGTVYFFDICWNDADIIINGQKFQRNSRYMFVSSFGSRSTREVRCVGYYEF